MAQRKVGLGLLVAYIAAMGISIFGSAVGSVALPWLMLGLNDSQVQLALVFSIQGAVAVIAACFGSSFLDRTDKRVVSVVESNLLLALIYGAIAYLFLKHTLTTAYIAIVVAASGFLASISGPAESAMIPELSRQSRVSNHRVNGIVGGFNTACDLLGPVVGGAIVGAFWYCCRNKFGRVIVRYCRVDFHHISFKELEPRLLVMTSPFRRGQSF